MKRFGEEMELYIIITTTTYYDTTPYHITKAGRLPHWQGGQWKGKTPNMRASVQNFGLEHQWICKELYFGMRYQDPGLGLPTSPIR